MGLIDPDSYDPIFHGAITGRGGEVVAAKVTVRGTVPIMEFTRRGLSEQLVLPIHIGDDSGKVLAYNYAVRALGRVAWMLDIADIGLHEAVVAIAVEMAEIHNSAGMHLRRNPAR